MAGARSPRFENWIQGSRKASGSNLLGPRNQIQVCFYFNNILSPPKKNNHKKIGLTWMIPYTSKKMNENLSNVVSTSMAITLLFFFFFFFFCNASVSAIMRYMCSWETGEKHTFFKMEN